ncbi:MAG: hypothetical protein EOO66_17025 [Methylobacterium sp.]|nr:MAG: hypothetical protein EOO66_17025 [Methylobacterium sp.]
MTTPDWNARDRHGMTALHKACLVGDWATATTLMRDGADPLLVDDEGRDAMWFAYCMLRGFRRGAAEAFAAGGVTLAAHNPLGGLTDREALEIGKAVFQRSVEAEGAGPAE